MAAPAGDTSLRAAFALRPTEQNGSGDESIRVISATGVRVRRNWKVSAKEASARSVMMALHRCTDIRATGTDEQTALKDIRKIVGRLLQGVAVGQRYK